MSFNDQLADLFKTFAAIMEIKGESVFKAIAFSKVSRIIGDSPEDLRALHEQNRLDELEGVGASSRKIIEDYIKTGRSTDFDEVAASVPAGLVPMLEIPGLGPKTVALLWKQRRITSAEELSKAIAEGKLDGLPGIGPKKITAIKEGIALRAAAGERKGIVEALEIAVPLRDRVRELPNVKQVEIAGSLRRGRETIGDVDLICTLKTGTDGTSIAEAFAKFPEVRKVIGQGETKVSVLTTGGLQVDMRIVPADSFGAALLYFTGSKDHNVKIRGMAQDAGMTLNEWGLFDAKKFDAAPRKPGETPTVESIASTTEAAVYKALGLEFVPPEMRENRGEVELAAKKKLPELIDIADIRGDLHTHTTASDGIASVEEMVEAARARGYDFLGITDHSKSQVIANGLTAERLLKHVKAIKKVAGQLKGFTLLAGCEVDILADGHLDFEDEILAELDYVVASPHVALKQETEKATARLLRAIDNKYVTIIGHPTGRLINARAGLSLDFTAIFKAAAANGTALEINAGYPRLDLNDINARAAVMAGCVLSINTDAHSTEGLGGMGAGITVARRAWVEKKSVINCMATAKLLAFLASKRS